MNPGARYRGPWTRALDRVKVWGRSLVLLYGSMCSCLGGSGIVLHCARTDRYTVTVCVHRGRDGTYNVSMQTDTGYTQLYRSHSCMCCNGSACTEPSCVIQPA